MITNISFWTEKINTSQMDFSKSSQNALQQLKINEINQDPRSFFVQRRRFTVPRSAPCTTDQKTENEPTQTSL